MATMKFKPQKQVPELVSDNRGEVAGREGRHSQREQCWSGKGRQEADFWMSVGRLCVGTKQQKVGANG